MKPLINIVFFSHYPQNRYTVNEKNLLSKSQRDSDTITSDCLYTPFDAQPACTVMKYLVMM